MTQGPDTRQLLLRLALDLRWSWSHRRDALWRAIDAEGWARTNNPFVVLAGLSDRVLAQLEQDSGFRQLLDDLLEEQARYQAGPTWWSAQNAGSLRAVAYFSMEFGIAEALPIYAGGLGILAGDALKGASDLGLPVTGIGLLFREGYFRQRLTPDGRQLAIRPANDPARLPLAPARLPSGDELRVAIELPGRSVRLRVWKAQVGRVELYLLDSNDPWNSPTDRAITNILYVSDPEQRLLQDVVLGMGGWRVVEALGLQVQVCHLNEGHAALAAVERARQCMIRNGLTFDEAVWATRGGNVFTTHTPVAAGFDVFPRELVVHYGRRYAQNAGVDEEGLMALGRDGGRSSDRFNMAFLAAHCSATIHGVSRRHAGISRTIFAPLYPRWPVAEIPVRHVTNGVHMASWDSADADKLWSDACGQDRWRGDVAANESAMAAVTDDTLWAMRLSARERLVRFARARLEAQLQQRGFEGGAMPSGGSVLDPNALTLGFARRFTEYKRPNLLMHDPERLVALLCDRHRPVQLILAGKAHPDDETGKRLLREWIHLAQDPRVRGRLVFLEDYDLAVASELVQGVDVWINTPREPWEACGTSGMKVLVNGGLNVSTLDGWWAEAWSPEVGWGIPCASDEADARRLLEILEQEVVPMFFSRDPAGLPRQWLARIRASLSRLTPQFSVNRMLREYTETLYRPAADAYVARTAGNAAGGRVLAAFAARLRRDWPSLRLENCASSRAEPGWRFVVDVFHGALNPDDVEVQLYADPGASGPGVFCRAMRRGEPIPGTRNAWRYELDGVEGAAAQSFTPRIVPRFPIPAVHQELPLIRWP